MWEGGIELEGTRTRPPLQCVSVMRVAAEGTQVVHLQEAGLRLVRQFASALAPFLAARQNR